MKIKIEATIDVSGEIGELIVKELRHFMEGAKDNKKYTFKKMGEMMQEETVGEPKGRTVKEVFEELTGKKVKPEKESVRKIYEKTKGKRGRPRKIGGTLYLRAGEKLCANRDCRQPFRAKKFEQKFCSIKCEANAITSYKKPSEGRV